MLWACERPPKPEVKQPNTRASEGNYVLKPKAEAIDIERYKEAAAQGYPVVQYELGVMYADGIRVPKDEAKAVEWYQKAAA